MRMPTPQFPEAVDPHPQVAESAVAVEELDWSDRNGFIQAGAASGVHAAIRTWLIGIYRGYQGDAEPRRAALLAEAAMLKTKNEVLADDLAELETRRDQGDPRVAVLQRQRQEVLAEAENPAPVDHENVDLLSLVGSLVLVLSLTVYLMVFYVSAGYSAFFKNLGTELSGGVDPGRVEAIFSSIFDVDAMSNAMASRNFFVLLFPVIFLGLGFVIHKLVEDRRYVVAATFILVALGFDVQLAYLIAAKLFAAQVTMGLASGAWGIGVAARDANFWGVILGGFVVYIVWTFVLGFLWREVRRLATRRHLVHDRRRQAAVMAEEIRQEETKREAEIGRKRAERAENRQRISELEAQADGHIVSWPVLEHRLEMFARGWQEFIMRSATATERATRLAELRKIVDDYKDEIRRGFTTGGGLVTLKGVR